MGLVLLRKGSQCLIGPVFTPFDPSTCVIIIKKKSESEQLQANIQLSNAVFNV